MSYRKSIPPGALALATLAAAMAGPARGGDFAAETGPSEAQPVDFPAVVGIERHDTSSILSRTHAAPSDAARDSETSVLSFALNEVQAAQDSYPAAAFASDANAGLIEFSRSFGNAALSLGSRASPRTMRVGGAYMIAPKLAIAGQAAYGMALSGRSGDSLANGIDSARSNAFSFALVAADRVRRGDRLSVSVSQSMQSYSGRIAMDMLSRSNGSGAARERLVFSMVPIGRGMRAQLNYQMPAGPGATFALALTARRNPNDLMEEPVETIVTLRYVKSF